MAIIETFCGRVIQVADEAMRNSYVNEYVGSYVEEGECSDINLMVDSEDVQQIMMSDDNPVRRAIERLIYEARQNDADVLRIIYYDTWEYDQMAVGDLVFSNCETAHSSGAVIPEYTFGKVIKVYEDDGDEAVKVKWENGLTSKVEISDLYYQPLWVPLQEIEARKEREEERKRIELEKSQNSDHDHHEDDEDDDDDEEDDDDDLEFYDEDDDEDDDDDEEDEEDDEDDEDGIEVSWFQEKGPIHLVQRGDQIDYITGVAGTILNMNLSNDDDDE